MAKRIKQWEIETTSHWMMPSLPPQEVGLKNLSWVICLLSASTVLRPVGSKAIVLIDTGLILTIVSLSQVKERRKI